MAVIIESLIGILLFTILIVSLTLKNPLTSVGDYPPAIREKCIELGLIEKREQRFTRDRGYGRIQGLPFPYQTVLYWHASWPAGLPGK